MRAVYFADCHSLVYVSSFYAHIIELFIYTIFQNMRGGVGFYGYKFGSHIHSRGVMFGIDIN